MYSFSKLRNWIFALSGVILIWTVIFSPVWEGFDETAHFCYVQHLVENHEIPQHLGRRDPDFCSKEVEATLGKLGLSQMLAYNTPQLQNQGYSEYRTYWSQKNNLLPEEIPSDLESRQTTTEILDIWQGQHPPLPYILLSIPYILFYTANFYVRFFALRLFSTLITLAGLWVLWKSLKMVVHEPAAQLLGFAALALHPMFFIMFGRISNESLTFFLFSAVWYFLLHIFTQKEVGWHIWVLLGVSYGFGMLSKVFFLTTLPAFLFLLCLDAFFHRRDGEWRKRLPGYLSTLGLTIAIGVPWYLYQKIVFGSVTGLGFGQEIPFTFIDALHKAFSFPWLAYFREIILNFIGLFGWSFIRGLKWVYFFNGLFMLATAYGIFRLRGQKLRLTLSALLFPLLLLAGMAYFNLRFDALAITGGWYFYSLSAMLATIVAIVWEKLMPHKFSLFFLFTVILFQIASTAFTTIYDLIPIYYAL